MQFLDKHFDKLLMTMILAFMVGAFAYFQVPDFIKLTGDVLLIIAVLVRERPKQETNVDANSAVVNQNAGEKKEEV